MFPKRGENTGLQKNPQGCIQPKIIGNSGRNEFAFFCQTRAMTRRVALLDRSPPRTGRKMAGRTMPTARTRCRSPDLTTSARCSHAPATVRAMPGTIVANDRGHRSDHAPPHDSAHHDSASQTEPWRIHLRTPPFATKNRPARKGQNHVGQNHADGANPLPLTRSHDVGPMQPRACDRPRHAGHDRGERPRASVGPRASP